MKKTLHLAAAALLAVAAFASVAPASAAPLAPFVPADAATSDRPIIVVITGDNCGTCADIVSKMEGYADKYPGVKFTQGTATEARVPADKLPFVGVIVPGAHITFRGPNFAPADIDAAIAQRVDFAVKQHAAVLKVKALETQILDSRKPFDAEIATITTAGEAALAPLQAQYEALQTPYKAKVDEIRTRRTATLAPLQKAVDEAADADAYAKARQALGVAAKPFRDELTAAQTAFAATLKPLQDQAAVVMKPFEDQIAAVEARKSAAETTLIADYTKAEAELEALLQADAAAQQK